MTRLCSLLAALQTRGGHPLRRQFRAEHLQHLLDYHISMLWINAWIVFFTVACGWLRLLLAWRAQRVYWRLVLHDTRLAWRRRFDARLLLLAAVLWPLVWALWLAR